MRRPSQLEFPITRRAMVRALGAVAGCTAAVTLIPARPSQAAEPHLGPKDPAAAALGYVEHIGDIDLKKFPAYVQGSICENCLQLQGTAGNNYRPCGLFPGKLVSVSGWCSAWSAEI